jgi:nucleoside-diphosphate-sugar epimerase
LFLEDFLRAVEVVMEKASFEGGVFQAASGNLATMSDVVTALAAAFGTTPPLAIEETNAAVIQAGTVSTKKIAALGFRPRLDLRQGCEHFVGALRHA